MYHMSHHFLGSTITLTPQVPRSLYQSEDGEDMEDSTTPRICVAPTFRHCMMGICGSEHQENWAATWKEMYVYHTNAPVSPPGAVPDADMTKEHWLLEPTEFRFVTTLRVRSGRIRRVKMEHRAYRYALADLMKRKFAGEFTETEFARLHDDLCVKHLPEKDWWMRPYVPGRGEGLCFPDGGGYYEPYQDPYAEATFDNSPFMKEAPSVK